MSEELKCLDDHDGDCEGRVEVFIVAGLQGRPWHLGTETEMDQALCGARPSERIGWAYGNHHPGNLSRVTCKRCLQKAQEGPSRARSPRLTP